MSATTTDPSRSRPSRRRSRTIRDAVSAAVVDLELSPVNRVRFALASTYAEAADTTSDPAELLRVGEKLRELLGEIESSSAPASEGVGAGDGGGARHLHGVMDSPPAVGD